MKKLSPIPKYSHVGPDSYIRFSNHIAQLVMIEDYITIQQYMVP